MYSFHMNAMFKCETISEEPTIQCTIHLALHIYLSIRHKISFQHALTWIAPCFLFVFVFVFDNNGMCAKWFDLRYNKREKESIVQRLSNSKRILFSDVGRCSIWNSLMAVTRTVSKSIAVFHFGMVLLIYALFAVSMLILHSMFTVQTSLGITYTECVNFVNNVKNIHIKTFPFLHYAAPTCWFTLCSKMLNIFLNQWQSRERQ